MRRGKLLRVAAVAMVAVLAASGCTGTENSSGSGEGGRIDYLDYGGFGPGSNPQANYNPYLESVMLQGVFYLFEPLIQYDNFHCEAKPWLATKYEFKDPQTLVFTMRDGVKWNDGQAFSADDVVFTFNMIKQFKPLDVKGIWRYLSSVSSPDPKTVEMKFNDSGASSLTLFNDIKIVPKHIWEKQADPVKFTNAENPVGTGPFTVKSMNTQQMVLARNPNYWQADKVKVNELRFHNSEGGADVEQLKLSNGEYDTNAMFVPDIKKTYVDRDPKNNHYWYPPGGVISVYMNLTKAPFSDTAFRKALLPAFNRQEIADKAQLGYVLPASQTGLVLPGNEKWLPKDIANNGVQAFDTGKADSELTAAGYPKVNGKRMGKDGKPIAFKFAVPGTWTDWVAAQKIIIENLTALGFTVTQDGPAFESYENDRAIGNYDVLLGVHSGSCNMFRNYQEPLAWDQSAPIGQKAASNFVRYNDPRTNELIDKLFNATDEDAQKTVVADLTKVMVDQAPVIPLWYGAKWFQYSTKKAEGWPNEKNPYAAPTDVLLIVTNLEPAGK